MTINEIHQLCFRQCFGFDIALLELTTSLEINQIVQPVCFPESDFNLPERSQVVATGWGMLGKTCVL